MTFIIQDYDGKSVIEVGYLFQKAFWHNGYAQEAAIACKKYAFEKLNANEVFSIY
ncbi:MAG: GNAT family N-acetyltransferase [Clostridia bacterium]